MTIQDFYGQFVLESKRESYFEQRYEAKLEKQLYQWTTDIAIRERIMKQAIAIFGKKIAEYEIETDCYIAIVDCMRDVLLEELTMGNISKLNCCELLRLLAERGKSIKRISEKQMNLVLSDFSREMFDYYIERYYYMKNIPINAKLEAKIEKVFQGKSKTTSAFVMHNYKPLPCSTESYLVYARSISPYFIQQIGSKKSIQAHVDAMEYLGVQIEVSKSRKLFPVVVILIVILFILLKLSEYGIIAW